MANETFNSPTQNITTQEAMLVLGVGAGVLVVNLVLAAIIYAALGPPAPAEPVPGEDPLAATALTLIGVDAVGDPDPGASYWAQAPAFKVAVAPQGVTMPALTNATISELEVQAVTDGKEVAFRVSWTDASADWNVDTGRFCDAVALGFPLDEGASPMMGHEGARVQIVYWKALWQKDIDEHFQDVQDVHPNYWYDLYWFAEGAFPYPVPGAFEDPRSHQWFVAKQAGNPMSQFNRTEPVEELVAEGWGTLTHQDQSASRGRGERVGDRWVVVFTRPKVTQDPGDYPIGDEGQMIFAVWEGSDSNVGGRKHWSGWVPFRTAAPEVAQ
jgi:Ethylbenzene dehydrogenase